MKKRANRFLIVFLISLLVFFLVEELNIFDWYVKIILSFLVGWVGMCFNE